MDDKILHNLLFKAAKDAEYTNFEIEQINLESEKMFIRYFLEREATKVVEATKIEDETLKNIYDSNQGLFRMGERVKIDTIFTKTQEKADEVLKEVNAKNFEKTKDKYDEKSEPTVSNDEFLFVAELQPAIAEAISKENKKGIIKKVIKVADGFHIIYLKEKEAEREATYEEAKGVILANVKNDLFNQAYNTLINDIANTSINSTPKVNEENKDNKDN